MPPRPFYHELPAYSPLSLTPLLRAAGGLLHPAGAAREQLRAALLQFYAADEVMLCGTGTQALQLALSGSEPAGVPVAIPAFGCFDIATAAISSGRPIILYDVDAETLQPDLDSLQAAARAGARVIVTAAFCGIPIEMSAVRAALAGRDCTIVEDAAQGQGATWRGRPLGSEGDVSVLSFGRGKGWTGGGGGALLLRDGRTASQPDRTNAASELATALRVLLQWSLGRPFLYGLPAAIPWLGLGETRYHEPGIPTGISHTAAAVLLSTLDRALAESERRRKNAAVLTALIRRSALVPFPVCADGVAGYLRLPVRAARGINHFAQPRQALRSGIAPAYPYPLHELPALQPHLSSTERTFPGASRLARELITLPTHSRTDRYALHAFVSAHAARDFPDAREHRMPAVPLSRSAGS